LKESPTGEAPFECNEVQLAVPLEDFLVCNWDWKDLRAALTDDVTPKVLWITEDAFIKVNGNLAHFKPNECVTASFQEISGLEQSLVLVHPDNADDAAISVGVAGLFWRAITTSNCVQLRIDNEARNNEEKRLMLPSAPLLSKF
jgi:hypothetical protein